MSGPQVPEFRWQQHIGKVPISEKLGPQAPKRQIESSSKFGDLQVLFQNLSC